MIENIRKYRGLIIVFIALVIFSLVIGIKDDLFTSRSSGDSLFRINGRTYGQRDFHQLGSAAFDLTSGLARSGDFGLYQMLMGLTAGATSQENAPEKFFANRILLREAKEEFGVFPGEKAISERVKSMRAFAGPEGQFSEEIYRNFVTKYMGRLGLTENDLRELVSDILAYEKISQIVGSGLAANREVVSKDLALQNQQVAGELGRLEIAPFKEKIQPTDEEIQTYWETIQDAFVTEPTRRFSYVIVTPDMPKDEEAEEEKPAEDGKELSEEEKKKAEDEKAKKAAELAEERRKKQLETDALVNDYMFEVEERKGEDFEKLAEENKWEVKTTELFAHSDAPADLDVNLRASSRGGKAVDELFRMNVIESDPLTKISQPIAIGENQWLVARLDEEVESRTKTFDEAKEEARKQYIEEKATEAMKTAAEEAATKIKAALEEGKSFTDAATDAGLTGVKEFSKVTQSYRPDPLDEPAGLFDAVRYVDPGALAEPVIEAERAFVIHVSTREVVKEDNMATRIDSTVAQRANQNQTLAVNAWLTQRAEDAKIEELWKK
ncbi:MAG: SurA N-terminal domain-containing protein [Akkermansiaceae bacterium]|nr:SurA N-terminal domain-containing protein [Akkermansiaceae bacterium]MCP5545188.1 SurA N-terminal domain-containing protein [Akkermansiaceae bacterium]MCP5546903.1 SurA N-terminal domain-containing protein [Akkermansiaceae bacterium]